MLGTQSGEPSLSELEDSLGRGDRRGGAREGTISKRLEAAWDGEGWVRPDLWAAHTRWGRIGRAF